MPASVVAGLLGTLWGASSSVVSAFREAKLDKFSGRGEAPQLTVNEMQELLETDLTSVRTKFGLSYEEAARSCALAVAFLILD